MAALSSPKPKKPVRLDLSELDFLVFLGLLGLISGLLDLESVLVLDSINESSSLYSTCIDFGVGRSGSEESWGRRAVRRP